MIADDFMLSKAKSTEPDLRKQNLRLRAMELAVDWGKSRDQDVDLYDVAEMIYSFIAKVVE